MGRPRTEIVSRETFADIEAARREGVPDAGRALTAARWANSGRVEEAARVLRGVTGGAEDLRLLFLGFQFFFRTGDPGEAERLARRRLEIAERAGETTHVARACTNLGTVLLAMGRSAEALGWCERAVEIDRRLGNEAGLARDVGNLANVFEAAGDLDRADALNREALEIAERIGAWEIAAGRLANLGDIAEARGDLSAALALWERAAAEFERMGIEKWGAACAEKIRVNAPRASRDAE